MAKKVERIALGAMSPGTERYLLAHRYGKIGARPKAYLQASIHADEIPAMMAAHHLIRLLDAAEARGEIQGEIVVVPVANPIGLAQNVAGNHIGRSELRGGGNFNRNWPDMFEGLVEAVESKLGGDPERNVAVIREAMGRRLANMRAEAEFARLRLELYRLAYDADIILDMHCDDEALMHIYLTNDYWPGGADLAAETGSRAVFLATDSGGQSFEEQVYLAFHKLRIRFGDRFPIPIAVMTSTVEFRGQFDVFDELGSHDGAALYRFLQRRGLIAGDPGPLPPLLCEGTPLDAADYMQAPKAGVLAYKVNLGDVVHKGDLIAEIIDPLAEDQSKARTELRAVTDGLVVSRCARKLVAPGEGITMIAGKEALAHRKGNLLSD
ncbi:MAG TPA: succinylglutamate desuccinylase/aspartoacylase family protein [Candidatus Binatia bacterium]|nr:succinylglutamate desuccinylase/aspartoacylase family protein [Candidatus Binatia bacterium]